MGIKKTEEIKDTLVDYITNNTPAVVLYYSFKKYMQVKWI